MEIQLYHQKINYILNNISQLQFVQELSNKCSFGEHKRLIKKQQQHLHLSDAFIQSDLQLHSGYTFLLVHVFPGNRTHNLSLSWRNVLPLSHTGTQQNTSPKCLNDSVCLSFFKKVPHNKLNLGVKSGRNDSLQEPLFTLYCAVVMCRTISNVQIYVQDILIHIVSN